jgi:putative copper resistance protein D
MPGALDLIAVIARFVQIAGACLLTGVFAFQVLVAMPALRASGAAARDRVLALDRRLLGLAGVALAAAMTAGFVDLARQAVVAEGVGVARGVIVQTVGALLVETRYGEVWLVRQMLWLLLAALLVLRGAERGLADWLALRLAGLALAAASLAAGAASGHAASAPDRPALAIVVDAVHLLAAGAWAGALPALALFLRAAIARVDPLPPLAAAVAVRRFSTLGLACVALLLATGVHGVVQQVGGVPAMLGTTYGRWLVLKLALLVPLLAVALVNLTVLRPRLERAIADTAASDVGARRPVARLVRSVLVETGLVAAVLGVVAVLGLTTPARHEPITWPLPFRLAWEPTLDLPGRVVAGALVAAAGVVAALALLAARRRWWRPALVGGAAAVSAGLALAAASIAVEAYPTTYVRPAVPYTTASIVRGAALYGEHCARCHGERGAGRARAVARRTAPPDLTGPRTAARTAGDLFWWTGHDGAPAALDAERRWDVVNFVRTLAAAELARDLGPTVVPPTIVAPDVRYTTGVSGERALRDHRGQTIVLLVFFELPDSLERLTRLSRAAFDLRVLGVEVVAVPLAGARALYATLGPRPLLFPFVIGGAEDAVTAYQYFQGPTARPVHMEMAIDRRGYLRARWIPSGSPHASGGWSDVNVLLRTLTELAGEPRSAPVLGEHIH